VTSTTGLSYVEYHNNWKHRQKNPLRTTMRYDEGCRLLSLLPSAVEESSVHRHSWSAAYPFDDGQRVGETQHPELPLPFVFSPQVPGRVLAIVDLRARNKHGVHKSTLNIRTTSARTLLTRTCLTPPGKHANCLKETRQQIGTPGTCTRYTTLQLAHKGGRGLHGL
jgi:hypothetical protein